LAALVPLRVRRTAAAETMLLSLTIRNFVLIEDAEIDLPAGLTALTGETGAGKTLLTQALELLLGERAEEGMVGPRGEEALVQGVFELGPQEISRLPAELVDLCDLEPGQLIVTRRLHRGGRNRAFLGETAVTLQSLGGVVGSLLAFSGQHEHRRLLHPWYQREVLDAFAGSEAADLLTRYRLAYDEVRRLTALLAERRAAAEGDARERELLRFQVTELAAAAPDADEEAALAREQRRLSRAEELAQAATASAALLGGEGEEPDVSSLLASARSRLASLAGVDDELDASASALLEAEALIEEAARSLRRYSENVEVDPGRLSQVEERLRLYIDLARKYGVAPGELADLLEGLREVLTELDGRREDLSTLEDRRRQTEDEARELAARLSAIRQAAAPVLQAAVETELEALDMPGTDFSVAVRSRADRELGPSGTDEIEFFLSANPGLPARPLARSASGGELSRVLLGLKAALRGIEGTETVVFDEIDAGIGGRTAIAVGRKLWELGRENQLLVVTHLPQVAAFADHHLLIEKSQPGQTAATRLRPLDERGALEELCRMMGGEPGDPGALEHARRLRDRAAAGLLD
jgi:DNA repair protein RecN (Recombination protein N)